MLREGDEIEVAPGDVRTVGTIFTSDTKESFNDRAEARPSR